jgi:glyoxylase-like metal-dependent hydrolase (beta-lactamase superfamily II)
MAFVFEEIATDIYQARGTGNLMVGSNTAIIVNDDGVVVIDSSISPAAAAALAEELQAITDKPIRYVINTHFHFDHVHGNQVYPSDVQIIGHEFTYDMLENGESVGRSYNRFADWFASVPGGPEGQKGLIPTPPNMTLSDSLTLHAGSREIQLLYFGRGHTGGDVVVYLPAEKVLIAGDLLLESMPYMGDGFPTDWIDTLEKLKALEFDTVVPGHGRPFSDPERIGRLQGLLADLWEKTGESCNESLSAEQAAARIDLTDHTTAYPEITGPGVPIATVERIYELRGCGP